MRILFDKIIYYLNTRFRPGIYRQPVIGKINSNKAKRALLVYITTPFHLAPHHHLFRYHQSYRQALDIAKILCGFGYSVDVVDFRDQEFHPKQTYDLVISHRLSFRGLEAALKQSTFKIYLSSGFAHHIANFNQKLRLDNLVKRRGSSIGGLTWDTEDLSFLEIADAIIGFGNQFVMDGWQTIFKGPCHGFNNYSTDSVLPITRDFNEARKHFIFLGSGQQLRKGLDLLLEIFPSHPDLHLWICSHYKRERDFCALYKKELFQTGNIHPCGFVDITGTKFRNIVRKCATIVYPTCSEGSPGSLINAMAYGMLPIATREAGVNIEPYGLLLPDHNLETIERAIISVSQMDPFEISSRSQGICNIIKEQYSQTAFFNRWQDILTKIHHQMGMDNSYHSNFLENT